MRIYMQDLVIRKVYGKRIWYCQTVRELLRYRYEGGSPHEAYEKAMAALMAKQVQQITKKKGPRPAPVVALPVLAGCGK